MTIKSVSLISFILILSASQGLGVSQYQTLDQFNYNIELEKNYTWRIIAEGRGVDEDISFRAEIHVLITQLDPVLGFSISMDLLSGSYPLDQPIDDIYGGWIWAEKIWNFPNSLDTFGQLIYPTDNSYWNSRNKDIVGGNYVIHNENDILIFVQGFIEYTGSVTDSYIVDTDTGLLQIYEHNAILKSNRNEDEIFELYFSLEYRGTQNSDEENNVINIMNFTLANNNIDLFRTISWGIITISLIGVIILNIRFFASRYNNQ